MFIPPNTLVYVSSLAIITSLLNYLNTRSVATGDARRVHIVSMMDLVASDGASIRTLSRIFHTAAKLSDLLQFTPHVAALHLRLLNASQSTFVNFRLRPPFFSTHNFPLRAAAHNVPTRALLPLLRSPASISSLRIVSTHSSLHLHLFSRSGVHKHFRLPLVDSRVHTVSTLPASHSLRSSPRLFLDILLNFHVKLDEITFIPSHQALKLTSFVDHDPSHVILRTEMTVSLSELESHHFPHQPTALTVPCRSLRTALDFCDPYDTTFTLSFTHPGQPLTLSFDAHNVDQLVFDVRFVFASRKPQPTQPHNARAYPAQLSALPHSTPTTVPHSHVEPHHPSPHTSQPLQAASPPAPSSRAPPPNSHVTPSTAYVSASQSAPQQPSDAPTQPPPSQVPHPPHLQAALSENPYHPYPALSQSDHHLDDEDDEYVEGTPPP
ncbi:Cell cycle checkpoint control protein RAD9A [Gracilariopsis chorda]|uniref:Cell cycle checkpoint control protein RAD9A n=1 Tax=Gracilariopsis chorda TaxID=448386 RepID=A0A2V3IGD8_9FLOR|nr:Cell cycle checkpoint control protein RAD9A [Gracilariopsis chorda]|eukprot:PXF41141.1 Cell cycle checkpoint control protein RAD9A [Gracilariopsis chorda]